MYLSHANPSPNSKSSRSLCSLLLCGLSRGACRSLNVCVTVRLLHPQKATGDRNFICFSLCFILTPRRVLFTLQMLCRSKFLLELSALLPWKYPLTLPHLSPFPPSFPPNSGLVLHCVIDRVCREVSSPHRNSLVVFALKVFNSFSNYR